MRGTGSQSKLGRRSKPNRSYSAVRSRHPRRRMDEEPLLAVGNGPLDAPFHQRPPGTRPLARRVDPEHPEARRIGIFEFGERVREVGDVGDAPDHRGVAFTVAFALDRHRHLGHHGARGDIGQLPFVAGLLDVAVQREIGSEHHRPGSLVVARPHFAYKHKTS